MSWLAPWAMGLGIAGALGAVLLHLIARRRPAAWMLPTARFIPDRRSQVSRAVARPQDLPLLALRVLVLLCAAAAFAQPALDRARGRRARVLLVDRSATVADSAAVARRAASLSAADVPTITIPFGTAATGSLTAALVSARRQGATLHDRADSVELVLLSPVAASQLDAATLDVRALWPGVMRIERVAARTDSARAPRLERAIPAADALGPALAGLAAGGGPATVRLVRGSHASPADTAFARGGGTVVLWDPAAAPLRAEGLVVGDDVAVAPLGRLPVATSGTVRARWSDGAPAAVESAVGAGCIRQVGIAVPAAGDLALRPAFQRAVRALVGGCGDRAVAPAPADSATLDRLAGRGGPASASVLAGRTRAPSPIVPWLLGAALALALLELPLRRRAPRAPVPA